MYGLFRVMYGLFCECRECAGLLCIFNTREEAEKVKNEIESDPEVLSTLESEDTGLVISEEIPIGSGTTEEIAKKIIQENLLDQ